MLLGATHGQTGNPLGEVVPGGLVAGSVLLLLVLEGGGVVRGAVGVVLNTGVVVAGVWMLLGGVGGTLDVGRVGGTLDVGGVGVFDVSVLAGGLLSADVLLSGARVLAGAGRVRGTDELEPDDSAGPEAAVTAVPPSVEEHDTQAVNAATSTSRAIPARRRRPVTLGARSCSAPGLAWRPVLLGARSCLAPGLAWRPVLLGALSWLAPGHAWRPVMWECLSYLEPYVRSLRP
ncbi:hypothetical protein ABIB25_001481 [Nakamurella sp. UYEF19]|uniref:hypothetical protein n=1 Tax=Nakamurella sp. UYEF19 TaxID=1756392 RepID=UPI003393B559